MKELTKGKMTTAQLADWFGVGYDSFRRKDYKDKKLKELEEYAEFEVCWGGVVIKRVFQEFYCKKDSNFKNVKKHITENCPENNLCVKKDIGERIAQKKKEYNITLKDDTIYKYTCQGFNELYGNPKKGGVGEIGFCKYVLCVKDTKTGEKRWFTEEEYKMKKKIREQYFKDLKDNEEIEEALYFLVKKGEMEKEEAERHLFELKEGAYYNYLGALEENLKDGILTYAIFKKEFEEKGAFGIKSNEVE